MLIFTHLCRGAAVLGLIVGAMMLLHGYQAAGILTHPQQWQFNNGLIIVLGAIVLGTLAEISFSVRKT